MNNFIEYKLNAIEKRILGRTSSDCGNDDKPVPCFWSGSGMEFNVKAREVWVNVTADYAGNEIWMAVKINGVTVSRFSLERETRWICVAKNLNPENENIVTVIKDTQPMPGDPDHILLINKAGLSEGGTFCRLPERAMNIEFIGDSISSGEGLIGEKDEPDWISTWISVKDNYAMQTARHLNADYSILSQCGWGLVCGWDNNIYSNMPSYYEQVCGMLNGKQKSYGSCDSYSFSKKVDYVVLNLGTNDNSSFVQPAWKDSDGKEYKMRVEDGKPVFEDAQMIVCAVKDFLSVIRKHNPSAKIIWTWGMIPLDIVPSLIWEGIGIYKKESGDNLVYTLELDSMNDVEKEPEDFGSRGHPGPKTHLLAAKKLTAFIKSLD